ncbi:MAG: hypothetical protein J2P36_27755, partial [Ktedonobacteraceae bacterium]|nr:hypothetical protein [Ktedonobacteraceae bacterium]
MRFLRYEGLFRRGVKSTPGASTTSDAADAVMPLDTDLPQGPAIIGVRGRRILWMLGFLALGLRLIFLPLGHYWDLTIDYNVFIDLAHNHSPYETFRYLSNIAVSSRWDTVYQYYAYPPVPLYIYYPLAKLYALLHPHATYFIAESRTFAVPVLTPDFFFLLKLPIWIADFLVAALLARMSGTIRGFRDYLLNPYVLMISGAWTFDAIMLLGLVAAIYALQRHKLLLSGLALAFGTMVKFFPVIALPTMVIYLVKKNRPFKEIVLFVGSYVVACLALLGPFAGGVIEVLGFHDTRPGGGMNWQYIWSATAVFKTIGWRLNLDALAAFGTPMLIIAMLLAYWYIWQKEMSLNRMIIVTLLGFFLGSKLINEQYALLIVPFAWLEAYRVQGAWRWFYRLFWMIPLAFAIFHVPIDHFFFFLYRMVFKDRANITSLNGTTGFEWSMFLWKSPKYGQFIALVLACAFSLWFLWR